MSQNKIKVLLADDNKDFCDVVAGHLNQQEDMSVISVAVDGIDAMNKIRDTRPDAALIDGIGQAFRYGRAHTAYPPADAGTASHAENRDEFSCGTGPFHVI